MKNQIKELETSFSECLVNLQPKTETAPKTSNMNSSEITLQSDMNAS